MVWQKAVFGVIAGWMVSAVSAYGQPPSPAADRVAVDTSKEPIASGPFEPTWESLRQYECPEWFR
ncbi:MAG TPA: hypothetical protein PKW71_10375, partial [Anaerohalosphaeraceae bacterium]|nr:hypothetical protein [Anaerohalosphaeraceae bacterium]